MEEVDYTIISHLKSLGVTVDDEVKSLSQFDAGLVYAGAAACLKRMTGMHCPTRLPASMSSRYKEASKLAEKLQEIGYVGDETSDNTATRTNLGYHTILYANASEIRRIFVFLFDKLPRDDDQTSGSEDDTHVSTTSSRMWRDMRNVVSSVVRQRPSSALSVQHRFDVVNRLNSRRDARYRQGADAVFWEQIVDVDAIIPTLLTASCSPGYADKFSGPRSSMQKLSKNVFISDLANNTLSNVARNELTALHAKFPDSAFAGGNHAALAETKRSTGDSPSSRPVVPPKPLKLKSATPVETSSFAPETDSEAVKVHEKSVEEKCAVLESELLQLRESATKVEESAEQLTNATEADKAASESISREIDQLETQLKQREKVFLICENYDEGLASLGSSLEKQRTESVNLQKTWTDIEAQYLKQKQDLHAELRQRTDTFSTTRSELRQCLEFRRTADEEADLKQRLLKRLRDEIARHQHGGGGVDNTKTTSRQFYTKRIADIINNTHKQRKEISRITGEIRAVHKDMNGLTGKRDRALLELDEIVFARAKIDPWAREVYRNVAVLYEMCEKMLKKIETRGAAQREAENVAHQTERLAYRLETSNIEHLQHDLDQIRQENLKLEQQMR